MKIDTRSAVALRAVIQGDLEAIARIEAELDPLFSQFLDDHKRVAAAYHVHNIYNALENSFDQISRSFENHVKDFSRWHSELLSKMFLDMSPMRPAVLPEAARPVLHDLLSFRHFFRHSYGCPLETPKLQNLWQRWQSDGPAVTAALRKFSAALPADAAL